jgi:hypothetical protein
VPQTECRGNLACHTFSSTAKGLAFSACVLMLIQQKAWNVFEDLKAKRTSVTDETLVTVWVLVM